MKLRIAVGKGLGKEDLVILVLEFVGKAQSIEVLKFLLNLTIKPILFISDIITRSQPSNLIQLIVLFGENNWFYTF